MTRAKWLQGALALGIVAAASVAYTADHLDSAAFKTGRSATPAKTPQP